MDILSPIRPYLTAIKLIGLGLVLAFLAIQTNRVARLSEWRSSVLSALSEAVDARDKRGALLPVKAKDAVTEINALGRVLRDVQQLRDKARADDAVNIVRVDRDVDRSNKEKLHDFQTRLSQARADADRLRASLSLASAGRMRDASATPDHSGGGGAAPLPALPAPARGASEAPGQNGFPVTAMTVEERLTATEQALQLDALIKAVRANAAIDPNAGAPQ